MGNTSSNKKKSDVVVATEKSPDAAMLETGSLTFAYNMLSMKVKNLPNHSDRVPHYIKYIEDVCKEEVRSKLIVSDFPSSLGIHNLIQI